MSTLYAVLCTSGRYGDTITGLLAVLPDADQAHHCRRYLEAAARKCARLVNDDAFSKYDDEGRAQWAAACVDPYHPDEWHYSGPDPVRYYVQAVPCGLPGALVPIWRTWTEDGPGEHDGDETTHNTTRTYA